VSITLGSSSGGNVDGLASIVSKFIEAGRPDKFVDEGTTLFSLGILSVRFRCVEVSCVRLFY
jgi:hypothetical protein